MIKVSNNSVLYSFFAQSSLVYCLPYSSHTSYHPSQTPCLPWIAYTTQKLVLDSCKMLQKQSEAFCTSVAFSPILKQNFIAYRSSKVSSHPDCIFEIHQQWQSGFCRVYSNCCCSCSSHYMYSNYILNFQESTRILNACTKKVGKRIECTMHFVVICFPEPVEIAASPSRDIRKTSEIIFGELWIFSIEYLRFEGHFGKLWILEPTMCLYIQSVCSVDVATIRGKPCT